MAVGTGKGRMDAKQVFDLDTHGGTDVLDRAIPRKTMEQRHGVAVTVAALGNPEGRGIAAPMDRAGRTPPLPVGLRRQAWPHTPQGYTSDVVRGVGQPQP